MPGMGAMNSELQRKLENKNKPDSTENHDSADKHHPAEESAEETTPKKSPYRPPGAKPMPGMGFGMGGAMGSELAGKLKSRNKASEEKPSETEELPPSPTKLVLYFNFTAQV